MLEDLHLRAGTGYGGVKIGGDCFLSTYALLTIYSFVIAFSLAHQAYPALSCYLC